jgi:hypothetical protein
MTLRIGPILLLTLLVASAGCTGLGITTPGPDMTEEEAKEQALDAEDARVTQVLENTSNLSSSSVGVYGEPEAIVIGSNSTNFRVRVRMPYSYEYSCDGSRVIVDGVKTDVVYRVTDSEVSVATITEDVQNTCR